MIDKEDFSSRSTPRKERRSGIERRWIKDGYTGEERRSGKNRRQEHTEADSLVPASKLSANSADLEKLLVSASIQLEAVTRLLINKGLIDQAEFQQVLADIHDEYQASEKSTD